MEILNKKSNALENGNGCLFGPVPLDDVFLCVWVCVHARAGVGE